MKELPEELLMQAKLQEAARKLSSLIPDTAMVLMAVREGKTYIISNITSTGSIELILEDYLKAAKKGLTYDDLVRKELN